MDHKATAAKSRRWKTPVFIVLVGVLLLTMMLWVFDSIGASALSRAVVEARALGGPLSYEEVFKNREAWPAEQNGATVIQSIQATLVQKRLSQDWAKGVPFLDFDQKSDLGRRWSPAVMERVNAFLVGVTGELNTIDTLEGFDGGQFPLQRTANPYDILLPHLAPLRTSAQLKSLDTAYRTMRGDTSRLASDLKIILTHGRLVVHEPTLISVLLARACDGLALRTLETALSVSEPQPNILREIQDLLVEADIEAEMKGSLYCERAFFISGSDHFRKGGAVIGTGSPGFGMISRIPGVQGILLQDEARGISRFNRMLRAAGPMAIIAESRRIDREIRTGSDLEVLTRTLFPSLTRAMGIQLEGFAERRCARAAVAAERYRLATGDWPAGLQDLVPGFIDAVPEDPCNPGQPLRLVRDKDRVIIYSLGKDNVDDGGSLLRGHRENDSPDRGFILLDPSARNQPPVPDSQPEETPANPSGWTPTPDGK